MIHLSDLTWTQFILIEIGMLLQFLALCASLSDKSTYPRRVGHDEAEKGHSDEHDFEFEMSEQADYIQPEEKLEPSYEDHHHSQVNVEHLTRTAKVPFVQTFNFRRHGS